MASEQFSYIQKKRVFDHFLWRKTSGVAGAIALLFFSILAGR